MTFSKFKATFYLLQLRHHDDVKMLHQAVKIRYEQRFGAVLCEVDEGGSSVRLHPRVALVLHGLEQS